MTRKLALLLILASVGIATAQEQLPADKLQKAVRLFAQGAGDLKDLQLKLEPDNTKPAGIKGGGDIGLIAVPNKGLAESLAKVGKEIVPVGQLWLRGVTLAKDGKALSGDKVRLVTLRDGEKETKLHLYLLGARRDGDQMELVVFAKEKGPVITVPMVVEEAKQELPIEMAGRGEKGREESAAVILSFLGKYKATIPIRSSHD